VIGVDPPLLAVGRHELDRAHQVARESVPAPEPSQAATERVADRADVRRAARLQAPPVRLCGGAELFPHHAGLDPGGARRAVDLDALHLRRPDQDRLLERLERRRSVPGALRIHLHAALGSEPEHGGGVVCALGERDGRRLLIGGQVPSLASVVPVGVGRGRHTAGDRELGDVRHRRGTLTPGG